MCASAHRSTADFVALIVLQALDIACQDNPSPTNPFPVAGSAIFNGSAIQPPATGSAGSAGSHILTGAHLALAIALPIVFVAALLALCCTGCYFLTRRRRRRMAASGKMRRVHEATWGDSPLEARTNRFNWDQAALDMQQLQGVRQTKRYSHSAYHNDSPHYSYRDDVGPGPGQVQDHELHEQYFAPPPVDPPKDLKIGLGMSTGAEVQSEVYNPHHSQYVRTEPPNLIDNSPVVTREDYDGDVNYGYDGDVKYGYDGDVKYGYDGDVKQGESSAKPNKHSQWI